MKWWQISSLLCTYGFFKEFRPSEPFITDYLIKFKNFTIEQVNQEMFPVGTYCYLFLLILVFLLTDIVRYKPVLWAGSVSGVITWSLLIWGNSMSEMQVLAISLSSPDEYGKYESINAKKMQQVFLPLETPCQTECWSTSQAVEFFYGFFLASEVAYFTYIYAKVDKRHYQKVTSHTRAAILLGKATAGLSSQSLVSLKINYLELNYFSIFGVGITIPVAFFLPAVPQSIYFHRREPETKAKESDVSLSPSEETGCSGEANVPGGTQFTIRRCETAFSRLYLDFKQAFTNTYVLQWSIWWALASCGYLQATSYCQLLWEDIIRNNNAELYNGYVEFIYAVSSAAVAFGVGYLKIQWSKWGEISLGLLTIIQGGFLFYSAYMNDLYKAYVLFILYRDFYEAAITVASYEVAKFISQDSYSLIFGINTFVAIFVQTILTVVVVGTLRINIRQQYQIYGGYHFAIGLTFLVYGILKLLFCRKKPWKK